MFSSGAVATQKVVCILNEHHSESLISLFFSSFSHSTLIFHSLLLVKSLPVHRNEQLSCTTQQIYIKWYQRINFTSQEIFSKKRFFWKFIELYSRMQIKLRWKVVASFICVHSTLLYKIKEIEIKNFWLWSNIMLIQLIYNHQKGLVSIPTKTNPVTHLFSLRST